MIIKCHIIKDDKSCLFQDVILSNENLPIAYKTKNKAKHAISVSYIKFDNSCKLTFIPNSIFRFFHNIVGLHIESQLECLEPRFFLNAKKLQNLSIENCKIKCLHAKTFEFAPSLKNLVLKNNQIENIHEEAFQGLEFLEWLILSNNNLKNLTIDVFRPLNNKLKYLDLMKNPCINKLFQFTDGIDYSKIDDELMKNIHFERFNSS